MRIVPIIGVCTLLLLSLNFLPNVSGEVLGAAYDYAPGFSEDFESMGSGFMAPGADGHTYWSAVGNGTQYAESLSLAPDAWGGVANSAYNGGKHVDDRYLAIYRGAIGETSHMVAKFRNATGSPLTVI